MIAKLDPTVIDCASMTKRKNLISSRIREDRLLPSNKCMESSRFLHDMHSRSKRKMVGIAEKDLCTKFQKLSVAYPTHSARSTDRHEERRFDDAMRRTNVASAPERSFLYESEHAEVA